MVSDDAQTIFAYTLVGGLFVIAAYQFFCNSENFAPIPYNPHKRVTTAEYNGELELSHLDKNNFKNLNKRNVESRNGLYPIDYTKKKNTGDEGGLSAIDSRPPFDNEIDLEGYEYSMDDEDAHKKFLAERRKKNKKFAEPSSLLPDDKTEFSEALAKSNFLSAGHHIGFMTRPVNKAKNLDLRSAPPVPRSDDDAPWFNESPYEAEMPRRRLE